MGVSHPHSPHYHYPRTQDCHHCLNLLGQKRTKLNANNLHDLYLLGLNPNQFFFIVSFCLICCIMFQSTATQYGHIRMLPFFMGLLPNIADVMTSEMNFEYNYPNKQLRLTCMDGWIRPFMLSFTLLTSNQVVRQ